MDDDESGMSFMSNDGQKIHLKVALPTATESEAPRAVGQGTSSDIATSPPENPSLPKRLLEEICERSNLLQALRRVVSNQGSPGVDGMEVSELPEYLKHHWTTIKAQLFQGKYQASPIRRVLIPKPGGGQRQLGIPTVLDRFIQQATLQVLQKYWDDSFSGYSYGFRPNRSAHQAVQQAQQYVASGNKMVVDIDLEKFFDRVHHDKLMSELAKRIEDKRVLKLIRGYLTAGVLEKGLVQPVTEGTPQGGPLSPFLSNVLLDLLDKELEKRGHKFVRYADDCNIFVQTERAGTRVMASIARFITKKLKLQVNQAKSAVAVMSGRKFLGFTFTCGKNPPKRRISPMSIKRFKDRVRAITAEYKGVSLRQVVQELSNYVRGWKGYYGFCQTPTVLKALDQWVRRRLRNLIWQQWKTCRNRYARLRQLGIEKVAAHALATSSKGNWKLSANYTLQRALNNKYFETLGLPSLAR